MHANLIVLLIYLINIHEQLYDVIDGQWNFKILKSSNNFQVGVPLWFIFVVYYYLTTTNQKQIVFILWASKVLFKL